MTEVLDIQANSDLNLARTEVMEALTGVSYMENNCTTMVYVRDGECLLPLWMRGHQTI